jgi:hypothetical protein
MHISIYIYVESNKRLDGKKRNGAFIIMYENEGECVCCGGKHNKSRSD